MRVVAFTLAALLFLGCAAQQQKGLLEGHISIGPICPVEKNPPDPKCQPTAETYETYPLGIYDSAGNKVMGFNGGTTGDFSITLAQGSYTIKQEKGLTKFSQEVQIRSGEAT